MFGKLLGKKKETTNKEQKEHSELVEKISKMNLTEMRSYVNNKQTALPLCEDGLCAVVSKLAVADKETGAMYLKIDDMDSKKRKAFELILLIAQSQKITFQTVELIQKFIQTNEALIQKYDTDYKEIYTSRFNDAIELALKNINEMSSLKVKMDILGENDN
jgi:hypothetical protein